MGFSFRKKDRAGAAAPAPQPAPRLRLDGPEGDGASQPPPAPASGAPIPGAAPGGPQAAEAPGPAVDARVEALVHRVAELGERVQGVVGAVEAMRQETQGIGQRLKDGDEKFLRLLALLETAQAADNPFVDMDPPVAGAAEEPPQEPRRENVPASRVQDPAPVPPPAPDAAPPAHAHAPSALASLPGDEAASPVDPPAVVASPAPRPGLPPSALQALLATMAPAAEAVELRGEVRALDPPRPASSLAPVPGRIEESVLLLEWADMLLLAVDRQGLGHLLDWYEGVGWIDAGLKQRLLICAEGIHAPPEEPRPRRRGDEAGLPGGAVPGLQRPVPAWRQDLDLHYRSLGFVARLRGGEAERLRLDEAVRKAALIRAR